MPLSRISRSRKIAYTAATVLGLLGGGAAVASATTGGSGGADSANPAYTSSVRTADTENEHNLTGLATVTPDQAKQAASTATGGSAQQPQLENENGNVVYSVSVTTPDGRQLDVKVDAGNAAVLAQEAGGPETGGQSADQETNDGGTAQKAGEKGGESQQEVNDAADSGTASTTNG